MGGGRGSGVDGRVSGVDGRGSGVDGRWEGEWGGRGSGVDGRGSITCSTITSLQITTYHYITSLQKYHLTQLQITAH